MATRYKHLPRLVFQVTSDLCWAAALESWLVGNHRTEVKRDNVPSEFLKYVLQIMTPTTSLNYLDATKLAGFASDPRIRMDLYLGTTAGVCTSKFFAAALERGYVYMLEMSSSGIGHCSVIYGVGVPEDGRTEMISVMDPFVPIYKNTKIWSLLSRSAGLKFGVPHGPPLKF